MTTIHLDEDRLEYRLQKQAHLKVEREQLSPSSLVVEGLSLENEKKKVLVPLVLLLLSYSARLSHKSSIRLQPRLQLLPIQVLLPPLPAQFQLDLSPQQIEQSQLYDNNESSYLYLKKPHRLPFPSPKPSWP